MLCPVVHARETITVRREKCPMAKKHLARGKNANFEEKEDESGSTKSLFKFVCLFVYSVKMGVKMVKQEKVKVRYQIETVLLK